MVLMDFQWCFLLSVLYISTLLAGLQVVKDYEEAVNILF